MNIAERLAILANPLSTAISVARPDIMSAAPNSDRWRLSSNPRRNLALWNALGVAAWAAPLALATAVIVNSKAKREVDRERDKSEDLLLSSSRPTITPSDLEDAVENDNVKRLEKIEADNLRLAKNASVLESSLLGALPIVALPASYWLANKLTTQFMSDKISQQLAEEREGLRKLQDAEDLERLKLLGMVESEDDKDTEDARKDSIKKVADGPGFGNTVAGFVQNLKDKFNKVSPTGLGQFALWDAYLVPALAASALAAVGGGIYLSKRDRDTKKVRLLTKKLLGENRLYDPPALSIDLPKNKISKDDRSKQLQMIEGIPSSETLVNLADSENSKEKDELFS